MAEETRFEEIIELELADLFNDEVHADDMFVDLGGNSIMAHSLRERLLKAGIDLSVNKILGQPVGDWVAEND